MSRIDLENFEEIYNSTYNNTLKYIVCNCSNIDDVNDIVQDTYVELYKILQKRKYIELEKVQNYIIGIAKNRLRKYYGMVYKFKTLSIFVNNDLKEYEISNYEKFDMEIDVLDKLDAKMVWEYIKKKKIIVIKVFYLYLYFDLKISEIAKILNISESNVKNIIYRTIKQIKEKIEKEGDINV